MDGGGGAGAAKDLRIRGMSSFSLSQRPAVYIDGVKHRHEGRPIGARRCGNQGCCNFNGGAGEDRLSDLNPNDIEHIEVLKGPAAATLYGSDASNGVIQIFTKKGRSESAPTWNFGSRAGYDRAPRELPDASLSALHGADGTRALDMNKTLIGNGPYQEYQASVNGGASKRDATSCRAASSRKSAASSRTTRDAATLRVNLALAAVRQAELRGALVVRPELHQLAAGRQQLDGADRQRVERRSAQCDEAPSVRRGVGVGLRHPEDDVVQRREPLHGRRDARTTRRRRTC